MESSELCKLLYTVLQAETTGETCKIPQANLTSSRTLLANMLPHLH